VYFNLSCSLGGTFGCIYPPSIRWRTCSNDWSISIRKNV